MKFPAEFSTKVDLTRVNWEAMKPWIAKRITELLGGLEDEVLIAYVYEQLEGKKVTARGAARGSALPADRSACALVVRRFPLPPAPSPRASAACRSRWTRGSCRSA
jgi:hypothetical protein